MNWEDVLKIVIGAMLALSAGVATQIFVARQSELTQRTDELIKFIWEYAELSSKYWSENDSQESLRIIEAKMVAHDFFIGSMLASMTSANSGFAGWADVERALFLLSNTTTGGNFQVAGRKPDLSRAAQVYSNASQLCVALRTARRNLIRFPFLRLPY
ncbi:MAG: hypothetical protein K8F90_03845 [Hyphomicrobiales bacterium]|nr:hypothetical protein [Hyphomicrobiales bacterium]